MTNEIRSVVFTLHRDNSDDFFESRAFAAGSRLKRRAEKWVAAIYVQ